MANNQQQAQRAPRAAGNLFNFAAVGDRAVALWGISHPLVLVVGGSDSGSFPPGKSQQATNY